MRFGDTLELIKRKVLSRCCADYHNAVGLSPGQCLLTFPVSSEK